jgi:Glyoxalase-like domain
MALRWYTLVVDCLDVRRQAAWWAEALDWTVIHEADDQCVIVPAWADDAYVEQTPWEQVGPGIVFVPAAEGKTEKNRLHLDLAPHVSQDREAEIARLVALGAVQLDVGQPDDAAWTVLADPEGNEFCVLSSRED